MIQRLTKVVEVDGAQCVTCALYGTDECRVHKDEGVTGCGQCPMFGCILNQLHAFEEIVCDSPDSKDEVQDEGASQ